MSDAISNAMARLDAMKAKAATSPESAFVGRSSYGTGATRPGLEREMFTHLKGWTWACLRVIANRISSQPVHVGRRFALASASPAGSKGVLPFRTAPKSHLPARLLKSPSAEGVKLLESHPLLTSLDTPNPLMSGTTLIAQSVLSLQITGEVYWWIVPGEGDGDSAEIWYLPPSWVTPQHDPESGTLFDSYLVRPRFTGEEWTVPGDQIMRVYHPDPDSPIHGVLSPMMTQLRAILTDEDLQTAQSQFFKRGIFPGVALVAGRLPEVAGVESGQRMVLTKEQRTNLLTAIRQQYQGVTNYGEPLILDGLITDVKKLSPNAIEMDFNESGKLTKSRICQAFGVNPISMGEIEGSNRASASIADKHLVGNTLNPIISHLSHGITSYFAGFYRDPRLVAFLEACVADDAETARLSVDLLGKLGAITYNEARHALGWDRLPDERGDRLIRPGSASKPDAPPAAPAP